MPRVVLGVSGGIAAYKSAEIVRRLRALQPPRGPEAELRAPDVDVTVVPTASALRFVGAATFEALSGNPVATDVFTDVPDVAHVHTGQHADLIVVAPATADLLARAATGRADDLLTATLLVTRAPVLMAPAMHTEMWTHPATVANVATLRDRGVTVLDPAVGRLTGADSGPGRLPEPEHVVALAELLLHRPDALPYDLAGRRVVISAGGTREPLDPVRFLGNRSSGRQGYAIALVAAARGADVVLVAANTELVDPPGVQVVRVGSALELRAAMDLHAAGADAVVMTAAVADFRPTDASSTKIKKTGPDDAPTVRLVQNPDVLAGLVAARTGGSSVIAGSSVIVGFAAETGDAGASVLEYGAAKLARKGCDLMVVNRVDEGRAFGAEGNEAVILAADGAEPVTVGFAPKAVLAAAIWDAIARRLSR